MIFIHSDNWQQSPRRLQWKRKADHSTFFLFNLILMIHKIKYRVQQNIWVEFLFPAPDRWLGPLKPVWESRKQLIKISSIFLISLTPVLQHLNLLKQQQYWHSLQTERTEGRGYVHVMISGLTSFISLLTFSVDLVKVLKLRIILNAHAHVKYKYIHLKSNFFLKNFETSSCFLQCFIIGHLATYILKLAEI